MREDVSWYSSRTRDFSSAPKRGWVPKKSRLLELFCEKICEDEELKKFGLSKDNIVFTYTSEEFERLFDDLKSWSVLISGKPMSQDEYYRFCIYINRFNEFSNRYINYMFLGREIKYSLHLTTKEQYEEIDKIKSLVSEYINNVVKIAFPVEEVKEEEEQSSVKEEEQSSVKEEEPKPVQPSDGEGSYSTPLALFIFGVCSIFFCLYYYA